MKKSQRKQIEELLFQVYDKGVQQQDCNLTDYYEKIKQALNKPAVMQQSEQLHIAQLIMVIEEFLEPLHPIRHSNSFLKLKAMCNCA